MMSYGSPPQYAISGPLQPGGNMVTAVPAMLPQQQRPPIFSASQQTAMRTLSGFQIFLGLSCIIIQIILIGLGRGYYYLDFVGTGIWCGAIYLIAGILGVVAAQKNKAGLAIGTMVMSILSTVLLWCGIGFSAAIIGISATGGRSCCGYIGSRSYCYCYVNTNGYLAADSIMLILAVAEFVVALWSAILCCKGACRVCCSCYDHVGYATQPVMYATGQPGGPQVIFMPQPGMFGGGQQVVMVAAPQPMGQVFLPQGLNPFIQPNQVQDMSGGQQPPGYSASQTGAAGGHTTTDPAGDMQKQPFPQGY